jgi:hypothetical protein
VKTTTDRWTESKVFNQLRHIFPSPAYVRIPQVRNGTGYSRATTRTADAVIASCWPSRGMWLAGVEIKVHISDWKKELARPEKAAEIQQYCNHWYVACPRGLIDVAMVPQTWGLIEVTGTTATIEKQAPDLTPRPVDLALVCSILRSVESVTVPKDLVDDQIAERVQEALKGEKTRQQYESNSLTESVRVFEAASGVKIGMRWDAGDIGAAVGFIRKVGIAHAVQVAERMAGQCELAAKGFRRAMTDLEAGIVSHDIEEGDAP